MVFFLLLGSAAYSVLGARPDPPQDVGRSAEIRQVGILCAPCKARAAPRADSTRGEAPDKKRQTYITRQTKSVIASFSSDSARLARRALRLADTIRHWGRTILVTPKKVGQGVLQSFRIVRASSPLGLAHALPHCVAGRGNGALSAPAPRAPLGRAARLLSDNSTSRVTVHRACYPGAHWTLQWVGAAPNRGAAYSGRKRGLGCDKVG